MPDLIEDYFDLVARYLRSMPHVVLQQPLFVSILQCGLAGAWLFLSLSLSVSLACAIRLAETGGRVDDGAKVCGALDSISV
jgi:hypothetical protein